jgi:hypothetical protein
VQDQAEAEEEDIVVDEKTAETIHDALRNAARVFTHADKALEDVQLLAYQYAEKVNIWLGQRKPACFFLLKVIYTFVK